MLILILALTSTLFSITAYSFTGFYNGFTNYVGGGENIAVFYSTKATTPYTGLIYTSLEAEIATLTGVLATSPEVINPSVVNDEAVFVRGIVPEDFAEINQLSMIEGNDLVLNDANKAIIGQAAAQKLDLKTGDDFIVFGVMHQKYLQLEVKGIFECSEQALNDEILIPLYAGQWLRGENYYQITLVRAKFDVNQTGVHQLFQALAENQQNPAPTQFPTPSPTSQAEQQLGSLIPLDSGVIDLQFVGVDQSQEFMSSYLEEYGVSKNVLIVLSIVVFLFASGTAITATTLFVEQHATDINTIRSIGVSYRKIKLDITVKMVGWALISTALGTVVSAVVIDLFQRIGYLQVLSHTISFQLDPLIIVANFALLVLIISVNMARTELRR